VQKADFGSASMERFSLHRDPDGPYLLYVSYEHPDDGRWRIDVIEADAPDAFDVARARTVLSPLQPAPTPSRIRTSSVSGPRTTCT
jgi:hypothetical protein